MRWVRLSLNNLNILTHLMQQSTVIYVTYQSLRTVLVDEQQSRVLLFAYNFLLT
jgi:hypothetical protein